MGMWVSAFDVKDDGANYRDLDWESLLWAKARENTSGINSQVAKGDLDIDVGSLQSVSDFEAFLMGKMGKTGRKTTV